VSSSCFAAASTEAASARALDAGGALGHRFLDRTEKRPTQESVKKKDDDDRGHSFEEQLAELVENLHRKEEAL
jgi:hypothetical protein